MSAKAPPQTVDVIFAIDGVRKLHQRATPEKTTVEVFRKSVQAELGGEERDAVYVSDGAKPLPPRTTIAKAVGKDDAVLHVGVAHDVHVDVAFNGQSVHRDASPAMTVRSLIAWAIGPKGHGATGASSDYQLKLGEEILKPDLHLGQLVRDHEPLKLALVFKVKPQGAAS